MINLNLLSPSEKKSISELNKLHVFVRIMEYFFIYFFIIILCFGFSYIILKNYNTSIQEQLTKEAFLRKTGQMNSINDIIMKLNFKISQITAIQSKYVDWDQFVTQLTNTLPDGIIFNQIQLSRSTSSFKFSGIASTRDSLKSLQDFLNSNEYFTSLNYPAINIAQKNDIPFEISGILTNKIYE